MAILVLFTEKLSKWHFLTPAFNLTFFGPNYFIYKSAILCFYPKYVSGSVQLRPNAYLKGGLSQESLTGFLFVCGSYEFLAMQEGKIREAPSF